MIAKRKLEEDDLVTAMADRTREKKEFEMQKYKVQLQLEMDRCERAGTKYNEQEAIDRIK